jgi:repressor LexA
MALTRRQKQVLDLLVRFLNEKGYSPSFEEIAGGLKHKRFGGRKLTSLATVHKHLATLEKKGFIRRGHNQSRSIEVVAIPGSVPFAKTAVRSLGRRGGSGRRGAPGAGSVAGTAASVLGSLEFPLLGRIAAGQPVEAIPNPETFSLGDFANGKGNVDVLKVKGDSMVDDHICNGDYILVEGANTAENGDIVVALVEGTDATLKRFFREASGKVRLQPANAQMDPIILPAREVKIQGRVIGVLRKY